MYLFRICLPLALLTALSASDLQAQKKKSTSDDQGYIPQVLPESKQKRQKKQEEQTLPALKEPPATVTAETDRLVFEMSPLSAKGLLSQQTREALKALLRTNRGTVVKLRAFVAGSGDLRRVGELVTEAFTEKHQPLPALSVIQVGALPLTGAQIVIEATETEKRPVNPNGIAFFSGQQAGNLTQSLDHLKIALHAAGLGPADALRVTCFVSSLDDEKDGQQLLTGNFPNAAVNYVQMQREPVSPAAECEAVARLRSKPAAPVTFLNPPNLEQSAGYSQIVLVSSPQLVLSGAQLAFGGEEADIKLAFNRLGKALNSSDARFDNIVVSHFYLTSTNLLTKLRTVRAGYYNAKHPPASTLLPFEGLPSLDAQVGLEVIAVPSDSSR